MPDELPWTMDAPSAQADGASWRPILGGSAADRALQAVDALAVHIVNADERERGDPSLSAGAAGCSLLFAQLAATDGGERASTLAVRYLDEAAEVLSNAPLRASLYGGFTGVAWAAELVGRLVDPEGEDPNEDIDDALVRLLSATDWEQAPYDLVHGLTGLGAYALERWPRPVAVECVAQVVNHLERLARYDETGTYWWTGPSLLLGPRRDQYPAGGVDLGVAHGIAGVIPFLARASTLGAGGPSARRLLDGAVRWLLAHAVQGETGPTLPYFVGEGARPTPARSAWCYGDPGAAAALLVAAREVEEPTWEEAAAGLAVRAAGRPPEHSGVTDAGFCHGSAGLAHLFSRMYQMTGEPQLADAAAFWLQQTLELFASADSEPATVRPEEDRQVPWNGSGVLEGAAGVALVLLSASTAVDPAWDRMFLVSRLAPDAAIRR